MLTGAFASAAWGEPRFTRDIDIVVHGSEKKTHALVGLFLAEGYAASARHGDMSCAEQARVSIAHSSTGIRIDLLPEESCAVGKRQWRRRKQVELLSGITMDAVSPEDLIISKMAYYRQGGSEKHLRDITGIMKVSGDQVDTAYVERWAKELGLTKIWQAILRRLNKKPPALPAGRPA